MPLPYVVRITYGNPQRMIPADYPGLVVPQNVPALMPELVTWGRMSDISPGQLPPPDGVTKVDLTVSFDDIAAQWRPVQQASAPGTRQAPTRGPLTRIQQCPATPPSQWIFQGGNVYLDLTITVYVVEIYNQSRVLAEIMSHELLHVQDELEIINNWLPAQLDQDPMLRRYLVERRPVDNQMFQHWFRGSHFQEYVRGTWAPEHNARGSRRDSPEEYEHRRRVIQRLRRGAAGGRTAPAGR